ncbi:MAG TPA: CheW domain-containing protein [Kofleriaceae bacterium]|nr:CheW domain-containing protein [Kofleriaceae bacterium]
MVPTSRPPDVAPPATTRLVLPLQLGDVWIAIDPLFVQELLGARSWVRVPGAAPQLPGVLAWRSRAIAVLELREVLGLPTRATTTPPRTVVARVDDCTFAFFVDVAREVRAVDPAAIGAPHAVNGRFAAHELALEGRVMPLVDLAAVIDAVSGPVSGTP